MMDDLATPCPLAVALAERLRSARVELATRWLERIGARVVLEPNAIFPTDELLDHVPLLIEGIAAYIEDPTRVIPADAPVVGKAMELGALRYEQGFDEYEILKEFELLGSIVYSFLVRVVRDVDQPCENDELLVCAHRVFRAIAVIQEASVAHFLQRLRGRLSEREARLRTFNRALTHELRNQIGAIAGAVDVLDLGAGAEADRAALHALIRRNAHSMRSALDNLVELSRVQADARQQRRVLLEKAVAESIRQLRDSAQARNVAIRVAALPSVEVPAAAVELAMTNYLSNAIKYADPGKTERWVEVRGRTAESGPPRGRELVVEVCDNGLGVPEEKRAQLFAQGFRAHEETVTGVEGMGLGLSIVRDAVEAVGGRAWAGFAADGGACFAFALPARRATERPAEAGTA